MNRSTLTFQKTISGKVVDFDVNTENNRFQGRCNFNGEITVEGKQVTLSANVTVSMVNEQLQSNSNKPLQLKNQCDTIEDEIINFMAGVKDTVFTDINTLVSGML